MTRKRFLPLGQAVALALVFFFALLAAGHATPSTATVRLEPGVPSFASLDNRHDEALERGADEIEASTLITLEVVGQIGGVSAAVAASGTLAYAGAGSRLVILGLDPLIYGESAPMPAKVAGLALSATHAYVAAGDAGLRVLDVSDPINPIEVGYYDTPGSARGVALAGDYAYVAAGEDGLRVIDVSNPISPTELGSCDTPGSARGVALAGNYAYIADGDSGLRILDVSDLASPAELGFYDTPGRAYGVTLSGTLAYVADEGGGLRILDVSDPASPAELGACDTPGLAHSVALSGRYAYVADGGGGLRVVDVSNPASPIEADHYDTLGYACDVAVSGRYVYVANGRELFIVDLLDPNASSVWPFDTQDAADVAVSGSRAYVAAEGDGLHVVDLSDPTRPRQMGFYSLPGHEARAVVVSDTVAYVAGGQSGLRLIDVTDAYDPAELGFYDTPGYAQGVAVSGTHAYVADGDAGLRVLDVSDPASPTELGSHATPGLAQGVAVSGTYAYVADGGSGLRVLDVSNPISPTEVGACDTPGSARGVALAGDYAYVADGAGGLRVVDVSNPISLSEVAFYYTARDAQAVAVSGARAYVANDRDGLLAVDVSDPIRPVEADHSGTLGRAYGVALSGRYACVANAGGGLIVLRIVTEPVFSIVSAASGQVPAGESVVVSVTAELAEGERLGAATLDVRYDPAVLDATACHVDPGGLFGAAFCELNYDGDGHNPDAVRLSLASAPGVTGTPLLAKLSFRAVGAAGMSSTLDLVPVIFTDPGGRSLPVVGQAGQIVLTAPLLPCYPLTRTHTGQGGDPAASPARSAECPLDQFHPGETLALTASPAPGWQVRDWDGTDRDASTWITNTAVMPAHPHTVTVNYVLSPSPVITLSVASGQVAPGARITLPVTATLPAGRSCREARVDVRYDPAVLDATACRVDPAGLFDFGLCDVNYDDDGQNPDAVRFYLVSASGVTGMPLLAKLSFQAVGAAGTSSTLDLVSAIFTDPGSSVLPLVEENGEVVLTAPLLPCYPLTRTHTGQGGDPAASPAHSAGCPLDQFHAGQVIGLVASPALGWRVGHWSGTGHDASAAVTNTATMPAGSHAVSVSYAQDVPVSYRLYLPIVLRRYPPVYTISGQVRNGANEPVAGVSVSSHTWHSAVTDEGGAYTLRDAVEGSYTLTAAKSGYACSASLAVRVPPDATSQDFTCDQLAYAISGRVTDQDDAALPGVTIAAGAGHTASTDSSGEYTLEGLEAGSYTLTASLSGYVCSPAALTVSVPPNATGQSFTCDGRPELVPLSLTVDPPSPVVGKPATIRLALRNQGGSAAQDFWLIAYINPAAPPTAPNQWWYELCGNASNCNGGSWYVEAILPGQTITLTSQDFWPGSSWWAGYFTTAGPQTLYTYVDWWADPPTGWGSISESDESNNLIGPVTVSVAWANNSFAWPDPGQGDPTLGR
ncbi:MAG: carboxypeptidase regulatory-like domain-containing protein [Thermoflexales bacterium]|nr:carboxypeptidase regulatory-like domain-containing protein [Thermoflexales bacterium]